MANSLTGLIPVIYKGLDKVARERVGLISKVTIDASASQAAVNQAVRSAVAPATALVDIAPGAYAPDSGSQTFGYQEIVISKSKYAPIAWTGEEVRSVGGQYEDMLTNQFAQAFRSLTNAVEVDLAVAAVNGASRAFGTVGTVPFGTANDLSDSAGVLKILDDNGAPFGADLSYVANSATMANFRGKQSVLFKVNEAGTEDLLRKGVIGNLQGMAIGQSDALKAVHTKGTGSGYLVNSAALVIGSVTIPADTGTGTILAGDVVTFVGDTNKYVVNTPLSGGSFTINAPGLLQAPADNSAITVGNSYSADVAFHKSAIILLARQPIMPPGGDAALDVVEITDDLSGLTFQVALYRQYRQIHIEIGLAWGTKVIKSEFVASNIH